MKKRYKIIEEQYDLGDGMRSFWRIQYKYPWWFVWFSYEWITVENAKDYSGQHYTYHFYSRKIAEEVKRLEEGSRNIMRYSLSRQAQNKNHEEEIIGL